MLMLNMSYGDFGGLKDCCRGSLRVGCGCGCGCVWKKRTSEIGPAVDQVVGVERVAVAAVELKMKVEEVEGMTSTTRD